MDEYTANEAVNDGENTTAEAGKTFTQDELNKIVSDRLAKEKARYEMELKKRDAEIQRKERIAEIGVRLSERGMHVEGVAEIWCDLPEEVVERNFTALATAIKAAADAEVDRRLRGTTPKAPCTPGGFDTTTGIRRAMGLQQ